MGWQHFMHTMDTVQETIIFLTWTIRDWYLLAELFQITVINCKLAREFSLENPVFLSDFQLSQPFLGLIYLQTAGVAGIFSPWFCILCSSGIVKAFVRELWDREQSLIPGPLSLWEWPICSGWDFFGSFRPREGLHYGSSIFQKFNKPFTWTVSIYLSFSL